MCNNYTTTIMDVITQFFFVRDETRRDFDQFSFMILTKLCYMIQAANSHSLIVSVVNQMLNMKCIFFVAFFMMYDIKFFFRNENVEHESHKCVEREKKKNQKSDKIT